MKFAYSEFYYLVKQGDININLGFSYWDNIFMAMHNEKIFMNLYA